MKGSIILTVFISLFFIFLSLTGLALFLASDFAFCGDIDLSESGRASCLSNTKWVSFAGFIIMIASFFGVFLSGVFSKKISKFLKTLNKSGE